MRAYVCVCVCTCSDRESGNFARIQDDFYKKNYLCPIFYSHILQEIKC